MAGNSHGPKITEIAQRLYTESGSYYGAAKRLGNPNLRAALHRLLNEEGFKPSEGFIKSLWQWADIKLVAFEAHPDSEIFDPAKLLAMGQIVAILVIPPDEWKRHSMRCAACGQTTTRWNPAQRYCNVECRKLARTRRRARELNSGGSYTVEEWQALCDYYGNKCLACGESKKLTADHVIPLTKGGSNDIGNIQPLCGSCNSSKGQKTIDYR